MRVYTIRYAVYTVHIMVDKSSFDAILYNIRKRLNTMKLSRLSTLSILSMCILFNTGCSMTSTATFKADHYLQDINRGYQQGTRPWHPPEGFGYGDQIPNMRGDYDRFCRPPENWRCG